jgi:hypothetical protein
LSSNNQEMRGLTLGALQSVYLWLSSKKCDKRQQGNRLSTISCRRRPGTARGAEISVVFGAQVR